MNNFFCKKEVIRFLVVGCFGVLIDLVVYYILLNYLFPSESKLISFIFGAISAYVLNKYWTFEKHEKNYYEIWKFGMLYTITLGVNVATNHFVLGITETVFLAFLVATGVSTVLNFLGQKFWVFK